LLKRVLRSSWLYYSLAALLLLIAVYTHVKVRFPSRPSGSVADLMKLHERSDLNVVFILIDTLRADRLSGYGYARPTSPWMDDLARHGVRFANAQSQSSWTKCSMGSLWTTLYPPRSGITAVEDVVPDAAVMPAERLRSAGFETAGIWRNSWVASNFGFNRGFDLYIKPVPGQIQEKMELSRRNPGVGALTGTDEDATMSGVEFIRTHAKVRFFLYLHYMDVHQYVFDQSAADLKFGNGLSDSYDSAIHWVDRNVGRMLQELDALDITRKTIVVIASDHGEGFSVHGEGHARTLYGEVTHVPLILSLPFRLKEGVVVEPQVQNVDIWPTLFELLGIEFSGPTDGRSTVPLIEAAASDPPRKDEPGIPAFAYLDRTWGQEKAAHAPLVSVQKGDYRLILGSNPESLQLFDTASDPIEQKNIADQHPDVVAELQPQVSTLMTSTPQWGASPQIKLDEMYREQLRALGYIVK